MSEENLPPAGLDVEVKPIAMRYNKANNRFITKLLNNVAESVLSGLSNLIPNPAKVPVQDAIEASLWHIYDVAELTQSRDDSAEKEIKGWKLPEVLRISKQKKFNKIAIVLAGGAGGGSGLPGTIVELPVTIGLIFREIQLVSKEYTRNRDPASEMAKLQCLSVFLIGTSLEGDNTADFEFIGARMALQGTTVQALITRVAPQLVRVIAPKLVSPPLLGGLTGAALNLLYINLYHELAHVNFQLAELSPPYDPEDVQTEFKRQVKVRRIVRR